MLDWTEPAAALSVLVLTQPSVSDIAGPDPIRMDDLVRQYLTAHRDPRKVVTDDSAGYFGTPVNDQSLVPIGPKPRLAPTHFADWLARTK